MPAIKLVIPARYASSRLPGKPLLDLGGRPMVIRVAEQAAAAALGEVWIATDHPEIEAVARAHGVKVLQTRSDHATGTDRIAEVATTLGWRDNTIVVNVQGDEPRIDPALIGRLARRLADSRDAMATVAHPLTEAADFFNPNVVKVVCDETGNAAYFSRAPIPYARDHFSHEGGGASLPQDLPALRHIGLYAYRVDFLKAYTRLAPAPTERFESLEQLRALWYGYRINVILSDSIPAAGVDTAEDAERMRKWFDQAGDCR